VIDIPTQLQHLFSAPIEEREDPYTVEIPDQEMDLGDLKQGETYHVAFLSVPTDTGTEPPSSELHREREPPEPPVEEVNDALSTSKALVTKVMGLLVSSADL